MDRIDLGGRWMLVSVADIDRSAGFETTPAATWLFDLSVEGGDPVELPVAGVAAFVRGDRPQASTRARRCSHWATRSSRVDPRNETFSAVTPASRRAPRRSFTNPSGPTSDDLAR